MQSRFLNDNVHFILTGIFYFKHNCYILSIYQGYTSIKSSYLATDEKGKKQLDHEPDIPDFKLITL